MDISFAVEKTLGRLAKWLRILGFDTLYEEGLPSGSFDKIVLNRVLLTRKKKNPLIESSSHSIFIHSNHYLKQLEEVINDLGITLMSIKPFSRCVRCNTLIENISKKGLRGKVPDYIWEVHDEFKICNRCKRIYWAGTHTVNSLEKVKELFLPQ